MKLKKLKKKIQQLEKRVREGSEKLATLRRKLQQAETAKALKENRLLALLRQPERILRSQQPAQRNQAVPRKPRKG